MSPARLCYLGNQINERLFAIEANDIPLTFTAIDNEPIESIAFESTFRGLPIFDDPNFIDGIDYRRAFQNDFKRVTFGNLPRHSERSDRAQIVTPKTWRATTKERVWQIRSWLHQLKGSQGVFYLPSFRNDFEVALPIGSGATTIDVVNRGYTTYVAARAPLDSVQIELIDGTVFRRTLTASEIIDENVERIGIDTSLGQEVAVADVARVSLIHLCRISGDVAELTHEYPGSAEISISAISVRE